MPEYEYFKDERVGYVRDPWGRLVRKNCSGPIFENPPPLATPEQVEKYQRLLSELNQRRDRRLFFAFL